MTALQQTAEARGAGCLVSGPAWDATYQDHYGWCRSVPQSDRDRENEMRAQTIAQCTGTASDPCDIYARTALQQADQARASGCAVGGSAWDADYQGHYNWCRASSQWARDRETQGRAEALGRCSGGGGGGACADPRVLATMDEWLRSATPPQQPGESLYYDEWGRVLGRSLTATISPAGNPDAPLGRCAWLLNLMWGLDSMNGYGTLGAYLQSRLQ
jgi:hypothetical protein